MTDQPDVTRAAREQARIAIELAAPETAGVARSLAAAVHRLADRIDYQEQLLDKWAREVANLKARIPMEEH
jgi:hypothetical protein